MDPVFIVGKGEIDETMIQGVKDCLDARELIKVKVLDNSMYNAREASVLLAEATGADCVQVIGSKFVLYLQKKKDSAYADLLKDGDPSVRRQLRPAPQRPPEQPAGCCGAGEAGQSRGHARWGLALQAGHLRFRCAPHGDVPLLCGLAEEQAVPALEVSGWEVEQAERGQRNYTVLTLEMLAAEYPGAALYLAIGSDMLLTFDGWHRWQDILKLAHLVVTSRNIGDDPVLHERQSGWTPPGAHPVRARGSAAHGQQRPSRPPCRRGPMRKRTPAPCPPCHPARGAVPGKQRRQQP